MSRGSGRAFLLTLLVALLATALSGGARGHEVARAPVGAILFTGGPGSLGPDGRLGNGVYAMNATGGRLKELAVGNVLAARWSPDGRKLAFTSPREDTEAPDLRVVGALGGAPRTIARSYEFAWSPDSRRIAFVEVVGSETTISVIGADGRRRRRVTAEGGRQLRWSPDGHTIVFVRDEALFMIAADGTGRRRLAPGIRAGGYPSWSPDGRRLAFYPCCDQGFAVVGVSSGRVTRPVKRGVLVPSWSPDGSWIALAGDLPGTAGGGRLHGTFRIRPDGSRLGRVSPRGGSAAQPAWSRDSHWIAVEDHCCSPGIWAVAIDGSSERRLTDGRRYGYGNYAPQWHPRGVGTATLHGRYVPASNPTDSIAGGNVVRTREPVARLAADGQRASYSAGGCESWAPRTRTLVRFGSCAGPDRVFGFGFAGDRVAWSYMLPYMGGDNWVVSTSTVGVPATVPVTFPNGGSSFRNRPATALAGDGELLVFSTWGPCRISQRDPCASGPKTDGELYRLDGARAVRIAFSSGALTPLAADSGRILLDHEDGRLELVRSDGSSVRTFPYVPGTLRGADLQGRDLVVLTQGALEQYDSETGLRLHEWAVAAGEPRLEDVHDGVAVYVSGAYVYLARLADGATVALPSRGPDPLAELEASGLFYAYRVEGEPYAGRVAFIPFDELPLP